MITFGVNRVPEFDTNQAVYKLTRNGKCLLDEFLKDINANANMAPEIHDLFAVIEDIANNKLNPKHKKLKLKKLKYAPYEVKSKHLRLYLFHQKELGQILLIGGTKGNQDKDLERVEKIIKEYTQSKNNY